MQRARRVLVVGGGVAGLAAGVALTRAGAAVRVFERAREFGDVGAGITLWNNALGVLRGWELDERVCDAGCVLERGELRSAGGRPLVATPLADIARGTGSPAIALHRARLADALVSALPPDALVLGREFVRFDARDGGVSAHFADGGAEHGDVLVGADGLRSRVRAQLHGDAAPRYAGYTCWRGLASLPLASFPAQTAWEVWGRGARFGIVRLDGERVYWFLTANAPAGGRDDDALARIRERVRGWCAPIAEVLARTEVASVRRDDVYDRPALATWGRGCVTLAGDAAHPMTPNLGQGACQGIEDAAVLAECLAADGDTHRALASYEARRRPRTRAITDRSRRLGWIGQRERSSECAVRDWLMMLAPAAWMRRAYEANVRLPRR